jgi:AcrR family transcriptional regulator
MSEHPREDGRRLRWATHRDARRTELVETAAAAVEDHGPDVHLDAIAAAAGVTKPVLYRYFTGKDDLLAAAALWGAEQIVGSITAALAGAQDERTAVESAVEAYLAEVEAHRNLFLLVLRHRGGSVGGSVAEGKSAAAEVLARALANGLSAAGVDPAGVEVWSHALVGMGLSTAEWWLGSGSTSRTEVAGLLSSFVWHAFDGVRRDRASTD